jgi:hypothetical protein
MRFALTPRAAALFSCLLTAGFQLPSAAASQNCSEIAESGHELEGGPGYTETAIDPGSVPYPQGTLYIRLGALGGPESTEPRKTCYEDKGCGYITSAVRPTPNGCPDPNLGPETISFNLSGTSCRGPGSGVWTFRGKFFSVIGSGFTAVGSVRASSDGGQSSSILLTGRVCTGSAGK